MVRVDRSPLPECARRTPSVGEGLDALAATLFDFPKERLAAFLANSARRAGLVSVVSMTGTKQMVLQNTGTTRKPDGPYKQE
jgi:hypothetical protein